MSAETAAARGRCIWGTGFSFLQLLARARVWALSGDLSLEELRAGKREKREIFTSGAHGCFGCFSGTFDY